MILCCRLDVLLWASRVSSVEEQNRLTVITEMHSQLPSQDPAGGSAGGLSRQLPWGPPQLWASLFAQGQCPSQSCPQPKTACGRNIKAQQFAPSPQPLPCHLQLHHPPSPLPPPPSTPHRAVLMGGAGCRALVRLRLCWA